MRRISILWKTVKRQRKKQHICFDWRAWVEDCLRWRGTVLTGKKAHWCYDWDGLPVDETTLEFKACDCFK